MTTDEKAYIHIEEVTKVFKSGRSQVEVLKGLNYTIERRNSLAIVGASGVGKSTLLYILGALEPPTSGQVIFDGIDLYGQDQKALALLRSRKIGFVFQFHHLLSEFNALENTAMPSLIRGLSRKEAYNQAEKILVRVGLKDRLTHRIGEMSGGEQQRVAVARALVTEPEVLLADEPTGNLDTGTGRRINDLIMELNQEKGLTMIIATHNLELARMMSSQVRLSQGRAIQER
ncbi:MAG: ABC transporter ATP-binding protein [Candidatus Adiutricales bacterium]